MKKQAKVYGACRRLNVGIVFSCNGHLFVEFDRATGLTSAPRPLSEFPTPAALRARRLAVIGASRARSKTLKAARSGGKIPTEV